MRAKRRFSDPVHQRWADTLGFPLDRLLEVGEDLPPAVRRRILALGREAVPSLLVVLSADELVGVGSPGEGFAPAHAATLLAELGDTEAIEPMLQRLLLVPELSSVNGAIVQALPRFGPAVLEPALRALAAAEADEARERVDDVVTVLAGLGVQDERVFRLLVHRLGVENGSGAWLLATYGDPRAVPRLGLALAGVDLEDDPLDMAADDAIDLAGAIRDLGGTLTERQQRMFERALERRRLETLELEGEARALELEGEDPFDEPDDDDSTEGFFDGAPAPRLVTSSGKKPAGPALRSGSRPTRNQPCWCGSGKKYKNCHLHLDEQD